MDELQILSAIKDNGGSIQYTELLNRGKDPSADHQLLLSLVANDVVSGSLEPFSIICFGAAGHARLSYLQSEKEKMDQQAAQDTKEKRKQFRHDWAIAIFSALSGALLSEPLWLGIQFVIEFIQSLLD